MAITQTQTVHQVRNVTVGRYIIESGDTAAAITITTGFKPRYVKVVNVTASEQYEYFEGMADASAHKRVINGTASLITTLGVTVSDNGFIIGLDADVNVKAEQLSWIAMG